MDHIRIMGFLLLLFTALPALQFAEARALEHHLHNAALSQRSSAVIFDSDLDAVAVASPRQNYSAPGRHLANYSESNPGSSPEISTHAANNTIMAVELLQKEATPGDGSTSKEPTGIKEVAPSEGNADILYEILNSESSPGVGHMSVNDGIEGNILSSSGNSPGVGHWQKSKTKYSSSPAGRTTPDNVLSSGPSPGVGNAHTSGVGVASSESDQLGTFNKLPSGSSPGVGHKVTNGYTHMSQDLESKKSAMMMNILPSGPSPGAGNSATNGRNAMEKMTKGVVEGMSIQTFNRLPSGSSPGAGHAYINAHQLEKLERASEDIRKESDDIPIFEKLPGGPSPGGGHSYVQKSALTMRMQQLASNALRKTSSSASPGNRNSSKNKLSGSEKKKVEQISKVLDWKIGCDDGSLNSDGTGLTPPMFGIATAGS